MKINKLEITNFKGIKSFELDLKCQDAMISGRNESGKTTIMDAFLWLMFGRDSLDQTNFEIKPINQTTGETMHGLETVVEGELEHEGKTLLLQKVYYEKWTKERGSVEKVFTGHTTDYYINQVPVKQSEYQEKINSIAKENVFKLLSNPLYFNENMSWTDRRNLLLSVAGNVGKKEIMATDEKLRELEEILKEREIDEHKRVLAATIKGLNNDIEKIPTRIDETNRNRPDISEIDFNALQGEITALRANQDKVRGKANDIKFGAELSKLTLESAQTETAAIKLSNKYSSDNELALKQLRNEHTDISNAKDVKERDLRAYQSAKEGLARSLENYDEQKTALLKQWEEVNNRTFTISLEEVCPACGQDIPKESLEETREKALKDFNLKKSKQLEEIVTKGKTIINPLIEQTMATLKTSEENIARVLKDIEDVKKRLQAKDDDITTLQKSQKTVQDDPAYVSLMEKAKEIEGNISKLKAGVYDQEKELAAEIEKTEKEIIAVQERLALKDQNTKALERIEELKLEERALAKQLEQAQKQLDLVNLYIKTQVDLLDSKINTKFELARFKLFEVQVNGGLRECCETLYKGIPYSSMNNAARINVGLDISRTLAKHYGVNIPCFCDNAESVDDYIEMDGQMIFLYVSKEHKQLEVKLFQKEN